MATAQFFQQGPELGNPFETDVALQLTLRRYFGADQFASLSEELSRFGVRVAGEITAFADDAHQNPPQLVRFDPWGRRIDQIETSQGWQQLARIAAEEGLVASGYERAQGALSRVAQFAKLYLFDPASAVFTCPLAMTDGAARLIEISGDDHLKQHAFGRLTSRDPERFWTSGQWMTERTGGSDVGRSETVARETEDGYALWGTKWFTSATTSEMAFTLARIERDGEAPQGSRGLSLFYLETRDAQGKLNQIEIHRLKDKLGTRALPTAELTLHGTPARLIGEPGRGVAQIVELVNVTRLYNAICSVASMRRALDLALDYAKKREAFGKKLIDQPLHLQTLAQMTVRFEANLQLVLRGAYLLGRVECEEASDEEVAELRLLTPLAKLYTAKHAVSITSEVLECFGGAGYVEDTGLPRLLRDVQVLPIWEGTTNVLSLDVLRAMDRDQALGPFLQQLETRLDAASDCGVDEAIAEVRQGVAKVRASLEQREGDQRQAAGRVSAYALAALASASLLIEQAAWCSRDQPSQAARYQRLSHTFAVEAAALAGIQPVADPADLLGL